jgi:hypothetical protein
MGHSFRVKWVQERSMPEPDLYGCVDVDARCIWVNVDMCLTHEQAARTLLHEVCHAVLKMTGVAAMLGDTKEESTVHALENGLWTVLPTLNKVGGRRRRRREE